MPQKFGALRYIYIPRLVYIRIPWYAYIQTRVPSIVFPIMVGVALEEEHTSILEISVHRRTMKRIVLAAWHLHVGARLLLAQGMSR